MAASVATNRDEVLVLDPAHASKREFKQRLRSTRGSNKLDLVASLPPGGNRRIIAVMSSPGLRANVPYTYQEYQYLPNDGRRYEIVEGELYVTPAPSPMHQTVSRRLQFALMKQLEEPGIAFIFNAPFDVILAETSVVEPDLAIIRQGRRGSLSKRGFEGAPDVVVEILSPSTRGNDVFLKKAAYARLGVAEYWIVDPELGRIEVFRLKEGGYDQGLLFDRSATLSSPSFPEIVVPLAPLFAPL
jgi:Uma2 family endonuclease